MMEPNRLMTVRQVARFLCVRDSVVRGWIRSGELRSVDLGDSTTSKLRITPDAISEFLSARTVPAKKTSHGPRRSGTGASQKKWF